jgi:hypothetical protein
MLAALTTTALLAAGGAVEAALPARTIAVDAQGRFTLPIACDADGPECAGDIRLATTSQGPREGRTLAAAAVAATRLGSGTFTLRPGQRRDVTVRLNAAGRRALARRRGRTYLVNARIRQQDAKGRFSPVVDGRIGLRARR